MRVEVDDVRLYFDVEGCGLAVRDREMVEQATLVLLHGGPGADHSLFKPEFSAIRDAAQVIYLDQRGSARITCPTLILAGQDDPVTAARAARRLAGLLPRADVHVEILPGVGHGVFRQAPAVACDTLRRFLPKVTRVG